MNEKIPYFLLEFLRSQFPVGSRVVINRAIHYSVPAGSEGVLTDISDAGAIYVKVGDRVVTLSYEFDNFYVIPPDVSVIRYYMPITASVSHEVSYSDLTVTEAWSSNQCIVHGFGLHIQKAWREYNHQNGHVTKGLMEYYLGDDSLREKVISCKLDIEEREARLWTVATCIIRGHLTKKEETTLMEYIEAQCSDGYGDCFSQQTPLIIPDSGDRSFGVYEVRPMLWTNSIFWNIKREEERFPANRPCKFPEGGVQTC